MPKVCVGPRPPQPPGLTVSLRKVAPGENLSEQAEREKKWKGKGPLTPLLGPEGRE